VFSQRMGREPVLRANHRQMHDGLHAQGAEARLQEQTQATSQKTPATRSTRAVAKVTRRPRPWYGACQPGRLRAPPVRRPPLRVSCRAKPARSVFAEPLRPSIMRWVQHALPRRIAARKIAPRSSVEPARATKHPIPRARVVSRRRNPFWPRAAFCVWGRRTWIISCWPDHYIKVDPLPGSEPHSRIRIRLRWP